MKKVDKSELKKLRAIVNTSALAILSGRADLVEAGRKKFLYYEKIVLRRHGVTDGEHTIDLSSGEIIQKNVVTSTPTDKSI